MGYKWFPEIQFSVKKKKNVKSSGMEWRRQDGGGIGNPVSIGPLNVALYLPNDSEHP